MPRPHRTENRHSGSQGRPFCLHHTQASCQGRRVLGLEYPVYPWSLLLELVVTPGALGPCQPQTGQRKLRWVPTWHQVPCRRAQGHPVSVSFVHPVETQQGPGWPVCHMNMGRAKAETGLMATEMASLMSTTVPHSSIKQKEDVRQPRSPQIWAGTWRTQPRRVLLGGLGPVITLPSLATWHPGPQTSEVQS